MSLKMMSMYRSFVSSSGGRALKLLFTNLTLVGFVHGENNKMLASILKGRFSKLVTGTDKYNN